MKEINKISTVYATKCLIPLFIMKCRVNQGHRFINKAKVIALILALFLPVISNAQDSNDLYIFGFSQTLFNNKTIKSKAFPFPADNPINGIPFISEQEYRSNTFALHQVNLFFRKPINEKTTFFLNIEATGSYSSQLNSGNFQIPEGWVSYQHSEKLLIKAGLLVPRFNNLNEIKNRLPLLPYLIRPTIYEALFYGIVDEEDYLPQSAYLQISGSMPLTGNYFFDYSAHLGNSEASYASKINPGEGDVDLKEGATIYKGESLTKKLAFGGRIGLKNVDETVKFGISGTRDHDDRNEVSEGSITRFPGIVLPAFGDVTRYRLGADLSFTYSKFNFEAELIEIFHNHNQLRKTPQYRNANLNKTFYYVNLTYNFTDKIYAFAGYNEFRDKSFSFILPQSPDENGVKYFSSGGGWKILDSLVFKGQVSRVFLGENPHVDVSVLFLSVGVSVIF